MCQYFAETSIMGPVVEQAFHTVHFRIDLAKHENQWCCCEQSLEALFCPIGATYLVAVLCEHWEPRTWIDEIRPETFTTKLVTEISSKLYELWHQAQAMS